MGIFLEIDGAMAYSAVWVNGQMAGGWVYGYSSYQIDIAPFVKCGGDNAIAIRLDNPKGSSRWYPGAGIHRNVWLTKTSPVHIAHWGTYVTTPEISPEEAVINLKGTAENQDATDAKTMVSTSIYELDGQDKKGAASVATISPTACNVPAGKNADFEVRGKVPHPKLWDTANPERYVAVTEVSRDGKVVDRYETPFGIRSIKFTVDNGFLLNGKRVQIKGVCNHHDLGALGAAFNLRAAQRQLEIMQKMGVNALRTSHNMPAPELVDLCDKMGLLVINEAFDSWDHPKCHDWGFKEWRERDMRAFCRRDRNHPSIILWSLGNEISEQGQPKGVPILADLAGICHEEDPGRPIAMGANWSTKFDPAFTNIYDVFGANYPCWMYDAFRKAHPNIPLFGSETASTVSSRGVYLFPPDEKLKEQLELEIKDKYQLQFQLQLGNFQVTSYDTYKMGWGNTPDGEFKGLEMHPGAAGEFVWTGFDYLGEPAPFNDDLTNLLNFRNDPVKQAEMAKQLKELGKIQSPARSSYFGIVDLAGFKKDRSYLYQSHWRPDFPMVHILPHWNWPDRIGKVTPVFVYTSGDEAELFLNGKSLGKRYKKSDLKQPAGLALHRPVKASSEETLKGNLAGNAVDGSEASLWVASSPDPHPWWQVDLGSPRKIGQIDLSFADMPSKYQYTILASDDGTSWRKLATSDKLKILASQAIYQGDETARYLKIEFTGLPHRNWASLRNVGVYDHEKHSGNPYRLCWNDVVYEPGALKAVALKDGKPWAQETVKTTGAPACLTLEVDRPTISKDGIDLASLTARVVDGSGLTVPVAQNTLKFAVTGGPGEIVATDNGDATDLNTFSNPERKASNGLALAIVRSKPGEKGKIQLTATSEGLKPGTCVIHGE